MTYLLVPLAVALLSAGCSSKKEVIVDASSDTQRASAPAVVEHLPPTTHRHVVGAAARARHGKAANPLRRLTRTEATGQLSQELRGLQKKLDMLRGMPGDASRDAATFNVQQRIDLARAEFRDLQGAGNEAWQAARDRLQQTLAEVQKGLGQAQAE